MSNPTLRLVQLSATVVASGEWVQLLPAPSTPGLVQVRVTDAAVQVQVVYASDGTQVQDYQWAGPSQTVTVWVPQGGIVRCRVLWTPSSGHFDADTGLYASGGTTLTEVRIWWRPMDGSSGSPAVPVRSFWAAGSPAAAAWAQTTQLAETESFLLAPAGPAASLFGVYASAPVTINVESLGGDVVRQWTGAANVTRQPLPPLSLLRVTRVLAGSDAVVAVMLED